MDRRAPALPTRQEQRFKRSPQTPNFEIFQAAVEALTALPNRSRDAVYFLG